MDTRHLDEALCRALLTSSLSPSHRKEALRHLRACPACLTVFARVRQELARAGELPPPDFYHPLEELLSYLQRLRPWPYWGWNVILYALIYLGWVVCVDMSKVFWLQAPLKALWPQIPMTIAGSYFYSTLPRLRGLVRFLWEAGVPYEEAERLASQGVAPIFGYITLRVRRWRATIPGWLTMGMLLIVAQVLFWMWTPQMFPTKDEIVAQVFLLYDHQVRAAAMWAVVWGILFVVRVADTLSRFHLRNAEDYYHLQRRLRTLVLLSLIVGSVTWAVWTPLTMYKEGRWPSGWGEIDVVLLLVLFFGYLLLEWKFINPYLPRVSLYRRAYAIGEVVVTGLIILSVPLVHVLFV